MKRLLAGGALLLLVTVTGCRWWGRTGEVHGVVRFRGEVLPSGTVTFVAADGQKYGAPIGAGGRDSVMGLPRGPVRIIVNSHPRAPEGLRGPNGPKEAHVKIPERYQGAES